MSVNYWELHSAVSRIIGSFPFFTGENSLLNDADGSGNMAIELCVEQALDFHSTIEPRVLLSNKITVPDNDRRRFFLMDPGEDNTPVPGWEMDFSQPLGVIIVPEGLEEEEDARDLTLWDDSPVNLAKFINYELVQFDDSEYLEIKNHIDTVSSEDTLLIRYSGRHGFTGDPPEDPASIGLKPEYDDSDPPVLQRGDLRQLTIKPPRKTAITYLATSLMAELAAIRAEKANDPASGMEFVTMRNKSSGYKKIVDFYQMKYDKQVGIDGVAGASSSIPMSPLNALNLTQVFAGRVSVLQSASPFNRSLNR